MAAAVQSRPIAETGHLPGFRILELDGVRGCAILLVLLFHCGSFPSVSLPSRLLRLVTGVSLGWSGVDLFFVLSGFLITGILLDTRSHPYYFRSFFARRVLRIFPLYFAFIAAFFWIALPLAHQFGHGFAMHASAQPWYWLYLSNWRVGFGLTHEDYLNHFWSLAIEEQFYLVWPLLVALLAPRRLLKVCLGIIAACLVLRCALVFVLPAAAIEFLTPFRIDTLAFGAVAAIAFRSPSESLPSLRFSKSILIAAGVGLFLLVFAAGGVSIDSPVVRTFGYTLFAALYAALVYRAALFTGALSWPSRSLRLPWLRSLGKYSYAIYVFHLPVYMLVRRLLERAAATLHLNYTALFALLCVAACTLLSYGLARLSWKCLEQPFLKMKSLFPYQN